MATITIHDNASGETLSIHGVPGDMIDMVTRHYLLIYADAYVASIEWVTTGRWLELSA